MPAQIDPEEAARRLGDEIRRLRRVRDVSQEALAAAAGLSLMHYGEIERGRRPAVRFDTLLKIADALETPLWMILEAADAAQRSSRGGIARSGR